MRYKLTPIEREARRARRAEHRDATTSRVTLMREWREAHPGIYVTAELARHRTGRTPTR